MSSSTIPTFSYVDHIGLSVPSLDEAVSFFCDTLGAEELYRSTRENEGNFMVTTFEAPYDSSFTLAMLRVPPNINVELFEWKTDDQRVDPPRASDIGGHHICFYVDDIDAACEVLRGVSGVRILGDIKTVDSGPVAGNRWTYFVSPWGLQMELVDRSRVRNPPRFVVSRPDKSIRPNCEGKVES